jgi:coenzyme F420-reducing hydrogenase beta subunit
MNSRTKENCCGCSACVDICPVHAISMKMDEEGFEYQNIDTQICINCGLCECVCGFRDDYRSEDYFNEPKAYGIKHKNLNIRLKSRSGAAFIGLSDEILDNHGVIYGAVMNNNFEVEHIRATSKNDRNSMQNAKYVQSKTNGIYSKVAEDLINGFDVLFSGTPCQISSLKFYLLQKNINAEKLICCDLVCHGVPSPQFWNKYLKYVQNKNHKKIVTANFRDKSFGWDSHFESFTFANSSKKYVSRDYTDLFYAHLLFRPSCYNCKFANINRIGDLTLADFWGVEKNSTDFDDNLGVSLLLVNTKKGEKLFNQVKYKFNYINCDLDNCLQPTLLEPSKPSSIRKCFWNDYNNLGFEQHIKKYNKPLNMKDKLKKVIKKSLYCMRLRKHP